MATPDKQVCRDCHSSGDFGTKLGTDPSLVGFRLSYDPTADNLRGHHGEGDEYRRSPHKNQGCGLCHDPHKSFWKKQGGVRFVDNTDEEAVGMMCTTCHKKRIRGSMGEIGLICIDCHMPELSAQGHRATHLWRINTAAVRKDGVTPNDSVNNLKEELSDSGAKTKYWMNYDETTGAGDSFITLDMACARCHQNMTLQQMSTYSSKIDRVGLADLTVNGQDGLQIVKKGQQVSVDFSVEAGDQKGLLAEWWVLSQGPKGWSYWNGTKWVKGIRRGASTRLWPT